MEQINSQDTNPKRPFFTKKRVIVGVIILVVLAVVAIIIAQGQNKKETYVTEAVIREDIQQTVEATAELESKQNVDAAFETTGIVSAVLVKEGNAVTKGQLLAQLESAELQAQASQAHNTLQIARAKLAELRAGATAEEIQTAQAAVASANATRALAQADLSKTQTNLTQTQALHNSYVADALIDLEQSNATLLYQLQASMIDVRQALSTADEVLGMENSLQNNDFEDILSILNEGYLIQAKYKFTQAALTRNRVETTVASLSASSTLATLKLVGAEVLMAIDQTSDTLLETRRVLDATISGTADLTVAELTAMKTDIDTVRSTIQTDQKTLQSLLSTSGSAAGGLTTYEQALLSAQVTRDQQVSTAQAAVKTAELTVTLREADVLKAQAQLAQLTTPVRAVTLAPLEATVSEAASAANAAGARLAKTRIMSPINGTVSKVNMETGENITASSGNFIRVETLEQTYAVKSNISEADITKIGLGNRVDITFDSLGSNTVLQGTIASITPSQTEIEGVIYYEVEVEFDENTDQSQLKPGMTADITIVAAERAQALTVPRRAIRQQNGQNIVRVFENNQAVERPITIGLQGDRGRTEILDGISEGEQVILSARSL